MPGTFWDTMCYAQNVSCDVGHTVLGTKCPYVVLGAVVNRFCSMLGAETFLCPYPIFMPGFFPILFSVPYHHCPGV